MCIYMFGCVPNSRHVYFRSLRWIMIFLEAAQVKADISLKVEEAAGTALY